MHAAVVVHPGADTHLSKKRLCTRVGEDNRAASIRDDDGTGATRAFAPGNFIGASQQ
jgi:hypothetical protein